MFPCFLCGCRGSGIGGGIGGGIKCSDGSNSGGGGGVGVSISGGSSFLSNHCSAIGQRSAKQKTGTRAVNLAL